MTLRWLPWFLLLPGCTTDVRTDAPIGQDATGSGAGTVSSSTEGTGGPVETTDPMTPSSSSSAGSEDGSGGPKFDLAPEGGPPGVGCAKVDFLFVVDNSGSMADEQQNLAASFPAFMATIQDEIEAMDYHLMVVSTDGTMVQSSGGTGTQQVLACSAGNCTCAPTPDCCADACALGGGQDTCFGVPCGGDVAVGGCDVELGAGRRFSSQGACGLDEDVRYVTQDDPDFEGRFLCLADVGTFGSGNEVPIDAMRAAIDPMNTTVAGCNAGFSRDDAVLVVTIITDEEDDHDGFFGSEGEPEQWHQAVLDAKGGNETAAVVLALVGDNDQPDGLCADLADDGINGAESSPRLRAFAEAFGSRGFVGSVCAPSYDPFFSQAVAVVDTACDEFEPEG